MKRCLSPAHLHCRGRRFYLCHTPSHLYRFGLPPVRGSRLHQTQWHRQFSVGALPPVNRQVLLDNTVLRQNKFPVSKAEEGNVEAWIPYLKQQLPPSLWEHGWSNETITDPIPDTSSKMTPEGFKQAMELANLSFHARSSGNVDLLAFLGLKMKNWSGAYLLLTRLLDAADALEELSLPPQCGIIGDLGSTSSLTLDQLTDQCLSSAPMLDAHYSKQSNIPGFTTLDAFTERPLAQECAMSFMAEVWQSLGSIVLDAVNAPKNESKVAMSYVFRILARLHHSGAISELVYKYAPPDLYQATFRPPGMHLLSTHIMDVLSDTAWLAHEAELAAKAAAAGEDSPFLPVKMGIRELGPEIWLEFILWCCVEQGYIKEGAWILQKMRKQEKDMPWKFESWKPLLREQQSVLKTNIDKKLSWNEPENTNPPISLTPSLLGKRGITLAPFNGLGKHTISVEVGVALLDNLPNMIYLGLGLRGLHAGSLIRAIDDLKVTIAPKSPDHETLLQTTRAANWLATRVIESGGLDQQTDPETFDTFLGVIPYIVPPWSSDMCPVDEADLAQLRPSQLYDDTAAFAGLIESTLRAYSVRGHCGDALNTFVKLQSVIDRSKMQRINEFFSSPLSEPVLSSQTDSSHFAKPFESSMPQISNITLAQLLDLVTTSRAFAFGDWLLLSDDVDGPAIPPNAYGDQVLAPSILRFAAATKNTALGESVIRSLEQPVSTNTLRALLNFRITMHEWQIIDPMLTYLRDYRSKSWGHSNIATLAAEVIRLDHAIAVVQQESDPTSMAASLEGPQHNLAQAKQILLRFLSGEFNESHHRTETRFQERTLYVFHRLFSSIPPSTSPSLREIVQSATLQYKRRTKTASREALPNIPITSFNLILSAIVDTTGSTAGRALWERWCMDMPSPDLRRVQKGGIARLYLSHERDSTTRRPRFDRTYFYDAQKKVTVPDVNTVRIIAQKAVTEYKEYEDQQNSSLSASATPSTMPLQHYLSFTTSGDNPIQSLEFCITKFRKFGLRRLEINREVGGHLYRGARWKKKKQKYYKAKREVWNQTASGENSGGVERGERKDETKMNGEGEWKEKETSKGTTSIKAA